MESFGDSVKLMLFVYALAAVVSFTVAWVIKLIFAGIQRQKARAEAGANVPAEAADEPAKAVSETAA
mgnify:FL=1|jgi:hypothetical protein